MTEAPTDKPASPAVREELYFDSLKEHRGAYFVEYQPPVADATFATMNVVFVDKPEDAAVVVAMMEELRLTQCRITLCTELVGATLGVIRYKSWDLH